MKKDNSPTLPKEPKSIFREFLFLSFRNSVTWRSTILMYLVLGIFSFVYAHVISNANSSVIEIIKQYDDVCSHTLDCKISITIPQTMKQPVFFYFGVDNFHQNFKTFIRSKSKNQLAGNEISMNEAISSCYPAVTNRDIGISVSWGGKSLDLDAIASPCGLIAKSYFTDKFELWKGLTNITLKDKDISWPKVSKIRYKRSAKSYDEQWIDPEDEHFVNWMNLASHPNFRKLWGIIEEDLQPGDYQIKIKNRYDASSFGGSKSIILSTASTFGGKNEFVPFLFNLIGVIFVLISVMFIVQFKLSEKKDECAAHKVPLIGK